MEDDGNWYDARLLVTEAFYEIMASGESFTTRGIFFNKKRKQPAVLWIPVTPTTEELSLPLHEVPRKRPKEDGYHIEITAHFVKGEESYELHVDTVRELVPGETIHHPDFKPPENAGKGAGELPRIVRTQLSGDNHENTRYRRFILSSYSGFCSRR